jgi:hypothetical protein
VDSSVHLLMWQLLAVHQQDVIQIVHSVQAVHHVLEVLQDATTHAVVHRIA